MRRLILAAALLGPLLLPAMADEVSDAKQQCIVISKVAIEVPPTATPEQVAQMDAAIDGMCGCLTEKMAEIGDDGTKMLRVLAKTTPEEAKAAASDPVKDKETSIRIVKAEFGLSDAEAEAWYARVDPMVKQLSQTCAEEATKGMQP
jgi:hypothetical protein